MTAGRVLVDVRPSAPLVIGLTALGVWLVGFVVLAGLSLVQLLTGHDASLFADHQRPLLIMALAAGVLVGLGWLWPQRLVIDADGLSLRRFGRRLRLDWDEVSQVRVVRGRGLRRAAWFLAIEPVHHARSAKALRQFDGQCWLALWSTRAATQTSIALQTLAQQKYSGMGTTDEVPGWIPTR